GHVVMGPFAVAPAVIAATVVGGLVIDFLPAALADVGNDQGAGPAAGRIVEGITPGIAQSERPDLRPRRPGGERVVRRDAIPDRIAVRNAHIHAEHFAEQLCATLGTVAGIVGSAAVAKPDIQEPLGPEGEVAAVVIGKRLLDVRGTARAVPSQIEPRAGVGNGWIRRPPEPRDNGV